MYNTFLIFFKNLFAHCKYNAIRRDYKTKKRYELGILLLK